MAFVHLRTHTEFSVVDGTLRIDDAVAAAAKDGQIALGIADLANSSATSMAGCITAALYLERFVPADLPWAHLDVYSWNDSDRHGRPAGGEAQALRSCYAMLKTRFG